jgi:tape measure domain-containing protein
MAITDILETKIVLKDEFSATAKRVQAATSGLDGPMKAISGTFQQIQAAGQFAAVGIAAFGVAAAGAYAAMKEGAKFENLVISLKAVEGSAAAATDQMKKLKEIAKMPGIGFEDAVRGYTGLRRGGLGGDQSLRLVESAGNANTFAGGNLETFQRMMLAFTQILNKPFLQGEELMQLNEAGLPASRIIRDKFGTADGGELQKMGVTSAMALEALLEHMEKMPKVAGGAQNALDNFAGAMQMATAQFGMALNEKFMPTLSKVGDALGQLVDEGYFQSLGESIAMISNNLTQGDPALRLREFAIGIQSVAQTLADFGNTPLGKLIMAMIETNPLIQAGKYAYGVDILQESARNTAENAAGFAERQAQQREKEAKDKAAEDAKPASAASQQIEYLKQIATNTKAMPEVMKTILGGGELGKFGVSATELKGMGHAKKAVKHLEIMGFGSGMSGGRKLARPGF